MGYVAGISRVFALGLLCTLFGMPSAAMAQDKKKETTKEKDAPKDKSGVEWTPILTITARAPAVAGATYVGSEEFKTEEKALRFKIKIASAEGKGGNMVLTLYKLGKPVKKIPIAKLNRDGEKEVAIPIEPGDYKIEVSVNNVNASVTIETGKKASK
ncbi:MAG: hypothetical protein WD768_00760 [Phycisphaeraceae bacterium]